MRTVEHAADEFGGDRLQELPERVRDALGELAGAAKEGLLALSVGVGLGVLGELLEAEVDEVVGPRGKHDPDRVAVRHGHEAGEVTLGGRRVAVERPRVRSADASEEVALETYRHFAARDALSAVVLELAGVSTRRYERTQEPVGTDVERDARSTSKSAISRQFVARTRETLVELMSRRLDDVRLAVLMIDGIALKERTNVVALGITTDGQDPARAVGRLDGERDRRDRAARRSRRPRPGCRAGRALCPGRQQGAAQGGARRARSRAGSALRPAQGMS
jgi:putative transposase